ncbi:MAG TPA: 2'-5' RNA ligase family protein [Patescibacteria group bacterium]|nr:2'-5' RNA ligase family protein [Patescibacteria group bacterium]
MFLPRNIVILPSNSITTQAISLSSQINTVVPSKILLNTTQEIPHITLYQALFPEENISLVLDSLAQVLSSQKRFSLTLSEVSVVLGTIFWNAVLSDMLMRFHSSIVDALNQLRNGAYNKEDRNLPGFTSEMEHSLQTYGMWAAKELYLPHLTLSRPIDENRCDEAKASLPEKIVSEFSVETIAFVEMGHDGTCQKILEKFSLK